MLSNLATLVTEQGGLHYQKMLSTVTVSPGTAELPVCLAVRSSAAQGVKDWEAVLHKAKGMFLKCPPRELIVKAPAYIKDTLGAGG